MRGMMHQMMKDQGNPGAVMGHVGGMMNMMNMMSQMDPEQMSKMMERCGAMVESTRTDAEKESQKQ
jgi:uncharacterized protein YjgD (DUF1641 family)